MTVGHGLMQTVLILCATLSSGATAITCKDTDVPLPSFHIHVLFWPSNDNSVAAALKFQQDFIDDFGEYDQSIFLYLLH